MFRYSTSALCLLLACMVANAEFTGPAVERFDLSAQAPTPSKEPGLAPDSARHLAFSFSCTQAFAADGDAPQGKPALFDRSCTFRSMDRAQFELPQDDPDAPEDEHNMRVFTYTKTGADTATVRCWEGIEYDDVRRSEGVVFEIRLTFTGEKEGTAQFAIGGQSCEYYGCGIFTLHR